MGSGLRAALARSTGKWRLPQNRTPGRNATETPRHRGCGEGTIACRDIATAPAPRGGSEGRTPSVLGIAIPAQSCRCRGWEQLLGEQERPGRADSARRGCRGGWNAKSTPGQSQSQPEIAPDGDNSRGERPPGQKGFV